MQPQVSATLLMMGAVGWSQLSTWLRVRVDSAPRLCREITDEVWNRARSKVGEPRPHLPPSHRRSSAMAGSTAKLGPRWKCYIIEVEKVSSRLQGAKKVFAFKWTGTRHLSVEQGGRRRRNIAVWTVPTKRESCRTSPQHDDPVSAVLILRSFNQRILFFIEKPLCLYFSPLFFPFFVIFPRQKRIKYQLGFHRGVSGCTGINLSLCSQQRKRGSFLSASMDSPSLQSLCGLSPPSSLSLISASLLYLGIGFLFLIGGMFLWDCEFRLNGSMGSSLLEVSLGHM